MLTSTGVIRTCEAPYQSGWRQDHGKGINIITDIQVMTILVRQNWVNQNDTGE